MLLSLSVVRRICAIAALLAVAGLVATSASAARTVESAPLPPGPYAVACTDVAYDSNLATQMGGSPADFWEGNPLNGVPRYFTDILLEPGDTKQIAPIAPNDSGAYPQTANQPVPFVVIVCYPTDPGNSRPDYPLQGSSSVPKMQRAGQKPIFPAPVPGPVAPGQFDPNRFPLLVFSHGLSASPLSADSLDVLTRLVSYGYVVAAPFHGDARFSVISINNIGDFVSVLYDFSHLVEMEALRPLALKATVDAILADADFAPHIDANRIGGFGASMGGAAMTFLLGASVTDGLVSQNAHQTVTDPRLKAVVGYVPFAGESFLPAFGQGNQTAANVDTPYLAITGTADTIAPMDRMVQAMNLFQHSHYMVALTGVPHGYQSSYAPDVFGWAIPFLNAYLRGDAGVLTTFLQQKDIAGGLDDNVVIDYTAPALGAGADCLFDWGEKTYPQYFSPASVSRILLPYYFRYYSATNAYLGTSAADGRVHYLDSASMQDLGPLAQWDATAGCP